MIDNTDSYNVTAEADQAHDDQWLADQIVALGVGKRTRAATKHLKYWYWSDASKEWQADGEFVRDWRVAGALIEKCQKIYIEYIGDPEQTVYARAESNRTWDWLNGESLPRMINEACVEALS